MVHTIRVALLLLADWGKQKIGGSSRSISWRAGKVGGKTNRKISQEFQMLPEVEGVPPVLWPVSPKIGIDPYIYGY